MSTDERKIQVLLVEDDEFLANIYKSKFEMEGFKVIQAGDGLEAVEIAKKRKPDIILLDILLPKMDGFEALTEIKKSAASKKIPVVMLTNLGQKEDVERGFSLGASDYLIKAHFKPSEIVSKVKQLLSI
jgi:DNA-binding response OmpR family regulator